MPTFYDTPEYNSPEVTSVTSVRVPTALRLMSGRFNPDPILGKGASIWKGPAGGFGLAGEEELDWRENLLRVVDFSTILAETYLRGKEIEITGEERLRRMRADAKVIRLGGKSFLALWNDLKIQKEDCTLEFLRRVRYITYLDFPGAVIRNPEGKRCIPFFYHWYNRGLRHGYWKWGVRLLSAAWTNDNLSASIISV